MKQSIFVLFLLLVPGIGLAQQNWDTSPNNPKNSIYSYNNSPNNWKNSPNNPANSTADYRNSPNNWANSPNNPANYVVYDDKGRRVGWYARNTNGVLVYFNADGKALPRPTSSGGGEAEGTATAAKSDESKESAPGAGGADGERSGPSQQQK